MTDTAIGEVRLLNSGYSREARSLLYQAYRHEPTFAYIFEAERAGYEQRVRATVRELVSPTSLFTNSVDCHCPCGRCSTNPRSSCTGPPK